MTILSIFLVEIGQNEAWKMKNLKSSGMQSILNGFLRYRVRLRGKMIKDFETVSNDPHVRI